jgi:hypothetical protein
MKHEDWDNYEEKRKKSALGSLALLKVKKAGSAKKKAPNREIVISPKHHPLIDVFRRFLGL